MWGIEVLLLIPFIINFKILGKGGKWTFYYLISSVVFATGTRVIARIWKNNMWFFTPMYFIHFAICSLFFYYVLKNKLLKNLILAVLAIVFVFAALDFIILEGPMAYNSYSISIETLLMILYSMLFFWEQLRDEELVKSAVFVNSLPDFWYNAGLFVYHCSYFMLALAYNFMQHGHTIKGIQNATLSITFIGGLAQLLLFYIGLRKAQKTRS